MPILLNQTINFIERSLRDLVLNDSYLFENTVHELCVNHRLAIYLEKNLPNDLDHLNVDCEYNRNGRGPKEINLTDGSTKNILPDIIIHQRGDNNHNYLAIEAKKAENNDKDFESIQGLLNPPYNYQFGLLLSYYSSYQSVIGTLKYRQDRDFNELELLFDKKTLKINRSE